MSVDDRVAVVQETQNEAEYIVHAHTSTKAKSLAVRRYMGVYEGDDSWQVDWGQLADDVFRVWLQPKEL